MAQISFDDVEGRQVPLFALRTNVEKLKELEKRWNKTIFEEFKFERQADKITHGVTKKVFLLLAVTGGVSLFLISKTPSATALVISIILMCSFWAGTYICISMAKSSIARINKFFIVDIVKKCKKMKPEAKVLMELEQNRISGRAANVVDNNEDPHVDIDYFIRRTKDISDGPDFSNFEKVQYMHINVSLMLGVIWFSIVLFLLYCKFYYRYDSSSLIRQS